MELLTRHRRNGGSSCSPWFQTGFCFDLCTGSESRLYACSSQGDHISLCEKILFLVVLWQWTKTVGFPLQGLSWRRRCYAEGCTPYRLGKDCDMMVQRLMNPKPVGCSKIARKDHEPADYNQVRDHPTQMKKAGVSPWPRSK